RPAGGPGDRGRVHLRRRPAGQGRGVQRGDRRPAGDGGIVPAAGEQPDHLVLKGRDSLDKGDFIRYYSSVLKRRGGPVGPGPAAVCEKGTKLWGHTASSRPRAPGTSSLRSAPPSGRPGAGSPR